MRIWNEPAEDAQAVAASYSIILILISKKNYRAPARRYTKGMNGQEYIL